MAEEKPRDVSGLTNAVVLSLERSPIRTRENGVTQSGWRMSIDGDQGPGTICLVELAGGGAVYRGDGACLGWSQEQLGRAYDELRSAPDDPPFELNQLG